jgi:hypothetical protein
MNDTNKTKVKKKKKTNKQTNKQTNKEKDILIAAFQFLLLLLP